MEELAKIILLAQEIRESSWSQELWDYKKTLFECLLEASARISLFHTQAKAELVHMLLASNWNESASWAEKQLKTKESSYA